VRKIKIETGTEIKEEGEVEGVCVAGGNRMV
jgi:hypothetical protein